MQMSRVGSYIKVRTNCHGAMCGIRTNRSTDVEEGKGTKSAAGRGRKKWAGRGQTARRGYHIRALAEILRADCGRGEVEVETKEER